MLTPIEYLAIGHVTEDVWPAGNTPGGTVMYAARAARSFVEEVTVLTAAGEQFDWPSVFPEIEVLRIPTPTTTQFENRYAGGRRTQVTRPVSRRLMADDLTPALRRAEIAHLAPVCNEVDPRIVDVMESESFVGVTPQGWLRRWDAQGHVVAGPWDDAVRVLSRADAVVCSIDDIGGDWALAETWAAQTRLLVVTIGERGCQAYLHGHRQHVAAPQVQEVEPTGAGDIFAATLFVSLRQGQTALAACAYACCIAAQSVTRPNLQGLPTPADIARCSAGLNSDAEA